MKKYKCLVLDHDDTAVNSTATIHYPCFIEYLERFYPEKAGNYTLESYFEKNFHPGVLALFTEELGFSAEELSHEERYWQEYVENHIPTAYDGIRGIICDFKEAGGIIAVNSHSYSKYILRDYEHNELPIPDIVYGWDVPKGKRKPAPDTLFDLMARFSLSPSEILVVDDLLPGLLMARGAGVDFAAAAWSYDIPKIKTEMQARADYYLKTVEELREILF